MCKKIISLIILLPMLQIIGMERSWAKSESASIFEKPVLVSAVRTSKTRYKLPKPILSSPVANGRKTKECRLLGINCDN